MNQPLDSTKNRALAGLLGGVLGGVVSGLLSSPPLGFALNSTIGAVLGLIFGLVFGARISSTGAGLVWGEAYGVLWWLIGPLTLIPLSSGRGLGWTIDAVQDAFPLLVGQVVGYGAVLGLSYYFLARGFARVMPGEASGPIGPSTRRIPTGQAIRIAGAIQLLMMLTGHDHNPLGQIRGLFQKINRAVHVRLHDDKFFFRQLARFVQDLMGNMHFANIMQQATGGKGHQVFALDSQHAAKQSEECGHPERVHIRVVVVI